MAGDGADEARARRAMLKLVRFCAEGARLERADGAMVLVAGDGKRMRVADALSTAARSAGLLTDIDGMVRATPAGIGFVKRLIAEREGPVADQPFQAQHRDLVVETRQVDGLSATVARNLKESPLGSLVRMKGRDGRAFIADDQIRAGERIGSDFQRAQLRPRISANWEASVASSGTRAANGAADLSDSALAARQRVERALKAIGPELSGIVLDVCCFEKGLERVERERQWPARSAKLMLKTGLAALSRHYGYRN